MVFVGPTGYESCTATTYCHWEYVSTGPSGPPPGSTPPPPPPNPNTGGGSVSSPPAPVNCDVKKAENVSDAKDCALSVARTKSSSETSCSGVPVTATKEISPALAITAGVDGRLANGNIVVNIGGKVMEEYHPQADCLRSSTNSVNLAQATCDAAEGKRLLAMAQLGCK